jgi:TonB family protein
LLSLSVYAQSPDPQLNHFATHGTSFDYPAGYSVADESTTDAQRFVITRKGSSTQLTIVVLRRVTLPSDLPAALDNFKEPIIKEVGATLGLNNSAAGTAIKTRIGTKEAEGVRLRSVRNPKRTGEVIWLRLSFHLVALSFVRANDVEAVELRLWETVRSNLKVEAPVFGAIPKEDVGSARGPIRGGVLNGKAVALPKPAYPLIARAAHASGTVVVQVLIDEEGNVISARAVSGHPLLQAASVAAAREAKFSPTRLEGDPVKVSGVIEYNFVAQ